MPIFFEKDKPKSPRRRSPPRRRRSANDAFTSTESPYLAYYMDRFHKVRDEKPDIPVTTLSTIISKEWNTLHNDEKQKYIQAAKDAKNQRKSVYFFQRNSHEIKSSEKKLGVKVDLQDNNIETYDTKEASTEVPAGEEASTEVPVGEEASTEVPAGEEASTEVPAGGVKKKK